MFAPLQKKGFSVCALHHAEAILKHDMAKCVTELTKTLASISIPILELVRGGGGEADFTQRLRRELAAQKWEKHNFEIKKTVDGRETQSISHEIDHVRRLPGGTFALEIEWNNKDPFFDRDLENFKRLHSEGAISVGGIITRGNSLQESLREKIETFARQRGIKTIADLNEFYTPTPRQKLIYERKAEALGSFEAGWADAFVSDKFGEATTHWRKLAERTARGVGNPCPLVLIGIPDTVLTL